MKKLIRLTESDLHNIVKESINKILNEVCWTDEYGHEHPNQHGGDRSAWKEIAHERRSRTYNTPFSIDDAIKQAKNYAGYHRDLANKDSMYNEKGMQFPSLAKDHMEKSKTAVDTLNRFKDYKKHLGKNG